MNKTELAKLVGVTQKTISEYEAERMVPSEDTLGKLASALRFPIEFFEGAEPEVPDQQSVSFRSMASLTAAQRDAALGAGSIAFEVARWIEERFNIPAPDLPDLREMPPEDAAATLREQWGLGVQPVRSMIHLLELHGVWVFSLAEQSRALDAFSVWHGTRPFCFLNTMKSVEHSRFDAAHELGHLVMHRHGHPHGRDAEHQANEFASAFLMPRSTVLANVPRAASLPKLIELKSIWGVSVAAEANRSHRVGVLSDWHYRSLCIEMGRLGYRTKEPSPITNRETSQVLNKVFTALRDDSISKADVARDIRVHVHDLETIVFGLVLTAVAGGRARSGEHAEPPKLKLV